jgi:Uma2 family endonuclease
MTTTETRISPEEYLVRERAAEYKSEYVDGEIRAVTGASPNHGRIVLNVGAALHAQLRGGRCEAFTNDLRVKVPGTDDYLYPDVVVVCGKVEMEDEHDDSLLNPTVVVEVLSPSTETYDRTKKWEKYRRISSLREYLLLAQDRPRVERYTRQGGGLWLFGETAGTDEVLRLDSIGCTLALKDVYERVRLRP